MRLPRIILLIIALNALVFLGWYFVDDQNSLEFMYNNFLVSWDALTYGRLWVLLTSVFSHNALFHLMINMFVLRSFGTFIVRFMGSAKFMFFYLLAGLMGSLSHAVVSMFFLDEPGLPALGASGAIAGIIFLFSFSFPRERLLLLGLIPMRAIWAALLICAMDVWGLMAQTKGGGFPIGHGAHLGGALTGTLWFFLYQKRRLAFGQD